MRSRQAITSVVSTKTPPLAVGKFELDRVYAGDCRKLVGELPDHCIDVVVTSPPYWGQRTSNGIGVEDDPRDYLQFLAEVFAQIHRTLKPDGIVWINMGDAYNTPINWRPGDRKYSSLGTDGAGLAPTNSAYVKPRLKRKPYLSKDDGWLRYGNLLSLPYRLIIELCERGYLFRGEVIWRKRNPMPEGRCRRPHRRHESIYLLAGRESHEFRTTPPVKSIWEFASERIDGEPHFSRFPEELPHRCIDAFGRLGASTVVLDPFAGSGTTGLAAVGLGCSFLGFEIDEAHVDASNERMNQRKRLCALAPAAG